MVKKIQLLVIVNILYLLYSCLGNKKLECVLSQWDDFEPMDGKFVAEKTDEAIGARIYELQKMFEFKPGEPVTPYNLNRLIPAFVSTLLLNLSHHHFWCTLF